MVGDNNLLVLDTLYPNIFYFSQSASLLPPHCDLDDGDDDGGRGLTTDNGLPIIHGQENQRGGLNDGDMKKVATVPSDTPKEEDEQLRPGYSDSKQEDRQAKIDQDARGKDKRDASLVKGLLKQGGTETRDLPKNKWERYGSPLLKLVLIFAASGYILYHLKYLVPTKRYSIPGMKRIPQFEDNVLEKMRQHRRRPSSPRADPPRTESEPMGEL